MKFGTLYSYWGNEWSCDYPAVAKKLKMLGFDIIEIGAGHLLDMSDAQLKELKAVTNDLGLLITSNIGPRKEFDVASSDTQVRKRAIVYLCDIMKKMDEIDSRSLVGVTYTYWPNDFSDLDKEAIWERGVKSVKQMGEFADSVGIDICLEVVNRFETLVLNTAAEGVKFCEEVGKKRVKLLMDTFHMNIEEDNICDAFRTAAPYLGHIHVGEANRKLPGMGSLPWRQIGATLHEIGFDGNVVMEPFMLAGGAVARDVKVWRDLSNGATTEEMDEMIRESLVFLRNSFAIE